MRYLLAFFILAILGIGAFFILPQENIIEMINDDTLIFPTSDSPKLKVANADIEPQKPLANPPKEIKAVYLTSWSAGNPEKINYLLKIAKETELNAVVIDIKDFSGYIAYDIKLPEAEKYKAKEIKIPKINFLIKRLHDEGIYAIARITIFQDPVLAKARPELAIHSKNRCQTSIRQPADKCQMSSSTLWLDHKKLAWIDPASKEAWDYNIAIAKDATNRGFDELNFDYIRFASDGNLGDMEFPYWDGKSPKSEVIKNFFKYLREQLPDAKISADFFGLATINNNDLGIGQIIENAYQYFDYVSPMVYPSHYAAGFLGYKNPANYPYEVVKYSMDSAINKLASSTLNFKSKLRPWLQDFDLGADYDAQAVRKQIQAIFDAGSSTPELINGWMLWNPSNNYTVEALLKE
ncbi:MAG: hypothetical protein UU85_C0001G0088 [Candidatus Wolfebacteria bacterium GW2011_GWA2_42_10]|uniref:DUF4015 domain-containing protein n=2 Tax=Candidatus Wolfeibacteriota TaxID=1752735 RepID=A0A0G1AK79_9BACT|nr:MAG: hypothetical protein UU38_C0003G0153 [Candidatus Wolfebacteria bacterium GW2011_GWB1_41_12]KKS25658.1 MAG: hypothetical protein UU85_C0001G0088 [Candidatus Wolfebacteria bacterium GW2011_GWA2_42_10]KKT56453.1 MAG: hypothetical protein UW50_C0001G0020 [Candidatus Wolfebacteria bacterium GW2011_GWA1_44_24]